MNISYKVVKLNKRYTGGEYFKYMIEFRSSLHSFPIAPAILLHIETIRFHEVRMWCQDNFGYGVEIDCWLYMYFTSNEMISKQWAFQSADFDKNLRIYIRNDESLSHLILSHLDIS